MDLRIFTEPQQGATYDDQLRMAKATEELGFDGFFRSDHYLHMGGVDPLPGPTDSWVTLAGLARETERIRLGTLVTSATFRHPGPLAIAVAQVDQMSGGRVELGLGAGWFETEHQAYAIPFPEIGERFDRLEEQLAIVLGLWDHPISETVGPTGETFGYRGSHYEVNGSPGLPKPTQQPHPPVIIGGAGRTRTPALAASYADEFNANFMTVERTQQQFARVHQACEAIAREPSSLTYSVALPVFAGKDDAAVNRRLEFVGRDRADAAVTGLVGTGAEIVDRIGAYAGVGASRVYLQVVDFADPGHLEYLAAEVLSQV